MIDKAKPILFNTDMVKAILAGNKNTTRRPIKPQPTYRPDWGTAGYEWKHAAFTLNEFRQGILRFAPHQPGDILYVRETWQEHDGKYYYRADGEFSVWDGILGVEEGKTFGIRCSWKPSIHMPKEAARIFLRVTEVKVERLQDITEEGATAEGVTRFEWVDSLGNKNPATMRESFMSVFNSIYPDLNSYHSDPWVWTIKFERVEANKCITIIQS